jgi:hypothetical protein
MENIVTLLEQIKKSTFVRINNYENGRGEVSNYTVIAHYSYENAVKKDIITLSNYVPANELEASAKEKFLQSLTAEKKSKQSIAQSEAYEKVTDCIKRHKKTDVLYFYCKAFKKEVIQAIDYKVVNSGELVIAQAKLAKKLKLRHTQYRNFKIDKIKDFKSQGRSIKIDC